MSCAGCFQKYGMLDLLSEEYVPINHKVCPFCGDKIAYAKAELVSEIKNNVHPIASKDALQLVLDSVSKNNNYIPEEIFEYSVGRDTVKLVLESIESNRDKIKTYLTSQF